MSDPINDDDETRSNELPIPITVQDPGNNDVSSPDNEPDVLPRRSEQQSENDPPSGNGQNSSQNISPRGYKHDRTGQDEEPPGDVQVPIIDVPTPSGIARESENDVQTPSGIAGMSENDVSTPPGIEEESENEVSNPSGFAGESENDVPTPSGIAGDSENDVHNPSGIAGMSENDVSTPSGIEEESENEVSNPSGFAGKSENDVPTPSGIIVESENDVPNPSGIAKESENDEPNPSGIAGGYENDVPNPSGIAGESENDVLNPSGIAGESKNDVPNPSGIMIESENVVPTPSGISEESENDVPNKCDSVEAPVYVDARLYSKTNKAPEERRVIWKRKDLSAEQEATPARHTCKGSTKDPYAKPDTSKPDKDPLDSTYVDMTEFRQAIRRGAEEGASSVPPFVPNQLQADEDNSKHALISDETCTLPRHTFLGASGHYIDMRPALFKENNDQLNTTSEDMKQRQFATNKGEAGTLPPLLLRPRRDVDTRATFAGVNKIPPLLTRPRSPCPRRDEATRDTFADVTKIPPLPTRPRSPCPRRDEDTRDTFADVTTIPSLQTRARSPCPKSGVGTYDYAIATPLHPGRSRSLSPYPRSGEGTYLYDNAIATPLHRARSRSRSPYPRRGEGTYLYDNAIATTSHPAISRSQSPCLTRDLDTNVKFGDVSTIPPLPTPRSRTPHPRSVEDDTVGDFKTRPRSRSCETVEIVYDRPDGVGRLITASTSTDIDSDEDDRGDPTGVDEGIFEDPTPREHIQNEGSAPQRSNSDEFDDDHSVFIQAETRRRGSDTTPPTSQMTSAADEMTDQPEQILKDKPGTQDRGNAHSGGSGYYSADEQNRKHVGRKTSERDFLASDWLDEDPCHLTIRGFPTSSTRESLESHIKRFGVDLDRVKTIRWKKFEKEAIMEFHDTEGKDRALTTLSRAPVMLEENTLQVTDTIPNTDPLKLFVSGLSPKAVKQCLDDALKEAAISSADIKVGKTPDTALVTFLYPSDVRTFQTKYHKQVFDGRVISSYPVEMTKNLQIRSDKKAPITPEILKGYLETFNRKSRAVENIVWNKDIGAYIATFRNFEDVLDVCATKEHEVGGCTVIMSPYYPCLELESSVFTLPKPVELQGHLKYLAGFWNGSRIYRDKFHKILHQNNGVLYHHKDGRLLVLCSVDRRTPNATQKIEVWRARCLHDIQTFSDSFSVMENINVASECSDKVFKEISRTFAEDTGSVSMMEQQQQDGHLVLAGEKARVSEILDTIRKREEEIQTLTKMKLLKTYELDLLRMLDDKAWKTLIPEFLLRDRCISFKGSRNHVEQAMTSLYEKLQNISERRIPGYGKMTKALPSSPNASKYIKQKLKRKRCTFDVKERDVYIYTMNSDRVKAAKELEKAEQDLVACIRVKRHKLRTNHVMNSTEWQMKLNELYHRRNGLFQLELTANEMKLVCVDHCFEEIYNDTLMFLDPLTEINSFYDIDLGKWRFIETYKKDELQKVRDLCKNLKVEMIESDIPQRRGFSIRGRKCDCQEVLKELRLVTEMAFHQDCKLAYPNLRDYVQSEECIQELLAVELDTRCGMHFEKIRTPSHQPEEIASRTVGKQQIVITEGDVTDMIVDIIVIPSDNCLQNMSSFGAAIVDNVGYEHQLKCDELVRNKGELEYGKIFLTNVGKSLPSCKAIVNVAVPVWLGGGYDEEQLLKLAIQNCLMATTEEKCKTIIFPSLDCTFNYPIEIATRVMVEAITDYMSDIKGGCTIEQVYICAMTMQDRNCLEAELRNTGPTSFRSSLLENDIRVHVVEEELAKLKVGVIVNSGNKVLNLEIGALSMSLLKEGGEQLQKQCHNLYPDGIRTGEVAVTDAAAMNNCKYVFHGALENWDGGKGRAEQIMGVFVEKCLSKASNFSQTSIAFPAIGTGRLGFRPEFVAELFLDCVNTYKCQKPDTTLKDVFLVVRPGDKATLEGFREVQARVRQSCGRPQGRYRVFSPQFFSQSSKFMKSYGDLSVEILQGDITNEKTEAIVNSVSCLNLNTGNVSKAIFSRTGPSVQTEITTPENKIAMVEDKLAVTGSGYLDFCRKIIHLEVRHGIKGWIQSIVKCLEKADNMDIRSISFPAIGTGGGGFQPGEMASAMFTAIRKFSESVGYKRALRRIRIVIFDATMMGPFISEAKSEIKRRSRFSVFLPKEPRSTTRAGRDITVHLYGENPEHVRKAERQLQNLFTKETISIRKMIARQLETGEDREAVIKIGQNHKVRVEITNKEITIQGWRSYVAAAKKDIDDDRKAVINIGQKHKVLVEIKRHEISIQGWRSFVTAAKQDIDDFIENMME